MSFQQRLPTKVILKAQKGDKFALTQIYHEYKSAILALSYRILQDRDAAEDIVQQVIEKVIMKVAELKEPQKFNGWLKTLSYRATIDYLNKKGRETSLPQDEEFIAKEHINESSLDMENYLKVLTRRERLVLTLFLLEGFKHQEIAKTLSLTEANSKQIYRRALNKLKLLGTKQAFSGEKE